MENHDHPRLERTWHIERDQQIAMAGPFLVMAQVQLEAVKMRQGRSSLCPAKNADWPDFTKKLHVTASIKS